MRILIAEDDQRIASFIERGLKSSGYTATVVRDGRDALAHARSGRFDLLILDLGLPGQDGLDVLHMLRGEGTKIPVVILTARDDTSEVVTGLEGGADDYITKPFRFEELLARVRLRLSGPRRSEVTVLRAGAAQLDLRTRRVRIGERVVDLSAREFALAEMLFQRPGEVLSRQELLNHVWGDDWEPGSKVLDVYIGYLRRKLGEDTITSVRGMGFRLEEDPSKKNRSKRPQGKLGQRRSTS
jgi:two-component system, OmpR family, copper resistance phosphate regulon response regulator CusR